MINQLTIIGLGLIGGSIASAIKDKGFCKRVVGYDSNPASIATAMDNKYIDVGATDIASAVNQADLIVLATPISTFADILKKIRGKLQSDTIITDTGSVKNAVISDAEKILGEYFSNFVPGHPIAGSEQAGIDAAKSHLFRQQQVILTPTAETNGKALLLVTEFWESLGAKIKIVDAITHDQMLALTSHMPQLLSYTFMAMLAKQSQYPDLLTFVGNGFRDFTRLAASNPKIWLDISAANRDNLLTDIGHFEKTLATLKKALTENDHKQLENLFNTAVAAKPN